MQQRNMGTYVAGLIREIVRGGISRPEISRRTGLAKSTLSEYASGEAKAPTYRTISKLEAIAAEVKRQG